MSKPVYTDEDVINTLGKTFIKHYVAVDHELKIAVEKWRNEMMDTFVLITRVDELIFKYRGFGKSLF